MRERRQNAKTQETKRASSVLYQLFPLTPGGSKIRFK